MKLNISRYGQFIPSWQGNDELPENEQIIIKYKRMTGEMAGSTMRFLPDGGANFDYAKIVKECVKEIINLEIDNESIKTGEDLLKATATHGLVTEIGSHILSDSKLSIEVEKKNQDSTSLDE